MPVLSHHDYHTTISKYAMENDNCLVPNSRILPDNYRINATASFGLHSSVPDPRNSTLLGNDAGGVSRRPSGGSRTPGRKSTHAAAVRSTRVIAEAFGIT